MAEPIRVVLADDHPLMRAGLRVTLSTAADIAVIGEATSGDEARRLCQKLQPDVVLLDLQMPGPPAISTMDYLCEICPRARILVLTAHDEDIYIHGLLTAGIAGYVLKDEVPEALLFAIRSVAQGGFWFSKTIAKKLLYPHLDATPDLSERERELLTYLAAGWSSARIADALHLSDQTTRNYLSRLYTKLNVRTRAEAMIWAHKHGWS